MTRRARRHRVARVGLALVVVLLTFFVVVPVWQAKHVSADGRGAQQLLEQMPRGERIRTCAMEAVTALWFFAVGACIGSFLNVVVYRMPRGRSVVWQQSSCPTCGRPIRATDNVPVLGWLWLGGRCRMCHTRIAARYPIVELLMGATLLALLHAEVLSGGANLPLGDPSAQTGFSGTIWTTQWALLRIYAYHAALLSLLLGWGLMLLDGQLPPARYLAAALIVALATAVLWPDVQAVGWRIAAEARGEDGSRWAAAVTSITGVAAGLALGWPLAQCGPQDGGPLARSSALALAIVGGFLGWQAAISVALLTAAGQLVLMLAAAWRPGLARTPTALTMFAAVLAQVTLWRTLADTSWWPGPASSGRLFAGAIVATTILSLAAGRVGQAQTTQRL